jgi:hypothetical protein
MASAASARPTPTNLSGPDDIYNSSSQNPGLLVAPPSCAASRAAPWCGHTLALNFAGSGGQRRGFTGKGSQLGVMTSDVTLTKRSLSCRCRQAP